VDFALLLLFYRAHGRFPNEPEGASTCDAMQD
jgi:hypothetical protein